MDSYVFRQELIINAWYLFFIFIFTKFIFSQRSCEKSFSSNYFVCIINVIKNKKIYSILIIFLWLLNVLVNIFYILSSFFLNKLTWTVFQAIGIPVYVLPLVLALFFVHLKLKSFPAKKFSKKFNKKNNIIFCAWSLINLFVIIFSILLTWLISNDIHLLILVEAIIQLFTLCSIIAYYNLKLKREKLFMSFILVIQSKIKNLNEWIDWLGVTTSKTEKYLNKLPILIDSFGLSNKIKVSGNSFQMRS